MSPTIIIAADPHHHQSAIATRDQCGMRGDQPTKAAASAMAESADSCEFERTEDSTDTEDRPAKEPKELNFWLPVHVAAREHREALAEVAGLVADGLDSDEAAELVGVDIQDEKLPALHPYIPSPATIAAGCLDAQAT